MCNSRHSRHRHPSGSWFKPGLGRLFLGALLVMVLWNAVLPSLFGWPLLGYWQAFGLLVLARLLVGWPGEAPDPGSKEPPGGRWREAFAAKMKAHCEAKNQGSPIRDTNTETFRKGFASGQWDVNVIEVEDPEAHPDGEQPEAPDDQPPPK